MAKERASLRLREKDTVAVLLEAGEKGDMTQGVTLLEAIPAGHKIALEAVPAGGRAIKYGHGIGVATSDIRAGGWVHTHNLASSLEQEWEASEFKVGYKPPAKARSLPLAFNGFMRKNGRVGIRNELWIVPTVGCVNGLLRTIAAGWKPPEWIDRARVLEHPYGCSQLGEDLEYTRDLLAGLSHNPNAAGVLVAALGCENLLLDSLLDAIGPHHNLASVRLQDEGDDAEAVLSRLDGLARNAERERIPVDGSELAVGVKCGGSDAFSSITANPLVGRFSDAVAAAGGSVLATEIPEMFGAEEAMLARAATDEVHGAFAGIIQWYRDYFAAHELPVNENPSPGNIAGGITTLEEKSLGAAAKSGAYPVTDVLAYGQPFRRKGVTIVPAPGNDAVSCTALAAAGAQLVLFTTGRGTPYATAVPALKIGATTALSGRKGKWTDFDAGRLFAEDGDAVLEDLARLAVNIANGGRSANEHNGIGEIAVFKDGAIL